MLALHNLGQTDKQLRPQFIHSKMGIIMIFHTVVVKEVWTDICRAFEQYWAHYSIVMILIKWEKKE